MLFDSGSVYLPGYGSFTLSRTPAKHFNVQNKVNPPSNELIFIPEHKEDDALLEYVIRYFKVDRKTASASIEEFTSNITNHLASDDSKYEIPDLGYFNLVNGKLNFSGNQNISTWYTNGLLPVIPIIVKKDEIDIVDKGLNQEDENDHTWRWLPFIFLLCILTFALKYYSDHAFNNVPNVLQEQLIEEDNYSQQVSDDTVAQIEEDPTTYCIIITGYFTKPKNVLKMVDRIESLGYEVFMEDIADGTRVGIRLDCTNMDLKQKMYDIRDTVSKESWYLEPPLKIE